MVIEVSPKVMRNINVGLAGFVEDAEVAEVGSWCRPSPVGQAPAAHVTKDAFERIVTEMIDGIKAAGPLDAVYLDLHGAMVTEHLDDGEGEIAARVRAVIGNDDAVRRPASICTPMSAPQTGR